MCTLYANTKPRELIRNLFLVSDNRAATFEPKDAILPSDSAPVVRLADDGERELVNLSWGFVRREPGKAPRRVVNTRDEQVRGNPFWRESFIKRRCLVPVTAYSEPKGVKPATWYWFAINDADDTRPLFAFPGIWRRYSGPLKTDGPEVELDVYSIMTTTPNELTASINHERMPVLLTSEAEWETWMQGTPAEAFALCKPCLADAMRIVGSGLERRDSLSRIA
ncbi:SOS response-associated peptidase family protein [Hyphomicrobium sp. CS1GBMeth3]|uniref:SOS response-associated peptidase n=1 Tax=Hyphomicrobium sp. CS1GBMeth3 TaxID=1892845 RepID=UPI0009305F38|nr:SOS response-associated peptidase family protein [Hyphomicrobium sp. CS1GBMeth3]